MSMSENSGKSRGDLPAKDFEPTLPITRRPTSNEPISGEDGDLDLDVDDIPTKLPYGSEDIADK